MGRGSDRRRSVRSAENTVHDLIAISNDLRRHINDDLAARGYLDLRPSFAPLLSRIRVHGVPQGKLADAMGVSPQAASQTVGLAVRAGYVTREPNPADRRSKLVVLSELGREFVADGAVAIATRAADYARFVGARPFAHFDNTLARMRAGLGIADDSAPVASLEPRTSIMSVSLLADHAMRELQAAMHAGGHDAISATQNLVLVHIGPDGARSSELARAQQVSRQAVSAILHDLEALGYVHRREDAIDARGVVFTPTRRGRRVLDDYVAGIDALEGMYEAVVGAARLADLARTARDLSHRILLERMLPTLAQPALVAPASGARRQTELAELATDLWRWLGQADAVRLTAMLRQLALDEHRSVPSEDAPLHAVRGTA